MAGTEPILSVRAPTTLATSLKDAPAGGRAEVFFNDTQIEVHGPSFAGAQINYDGQRALSWQTFWFGPLLGEGELGAPGDVSRALPARRARQKRFVGYAVFLLRPAFGRLLYAAR